MCQGKANRLGGMNLNGRGAKGALLLHPPLRKPGGIEREDVFNVLEIVREASLEGGGGTLFPGSKHAAEWTAIAAMAPAAFLMNDNRQRS
jgi:hypothetical protein